jgi:hypothetical protein
MATEMEYRRLGGSGFKVPALCLGTGTFGGSNEFFRAWGTTGVEEATRLVDICLEAGLNFFDSADIYSDGQAEEVLGGAIKGRRDQVLISTKATFRSGEGPNDVGSSRWHLIQSVEGSLRRLGTDYIDLLLTRSTPLLPKLGKLSRKLRSIGCSSGRVFPLSSSVPATKNSCVKTWAQSAGALRLSRSQGSMLPAPRPPSIRTGTSRASPSATLSRHHRALLSQFFEFRSGYVIA